MIQTESPYYQRNPKPPAPFGSSIGYYNSDPKYFEDNSNDELGGSDASWALVMNKCKDITIFGAGLYSWFSTYSQDCIDEQKCQKVLAKFDDNFKGITILHLITIGAKYMASVNGKGIAVKDNLNVKDHPAWSQVSMLEVPGGDGDIDACNNSSECKDTLCTIGGDSYCEDGYCVCAAYSCGDDVTNECSNLKCGNSDDLELIDACINKGCRCAYGISIGAESTSNVGFNRSVDLRYSNYQHPNYNFKKTKTRGPS